MKGRSFFIINIILVDTCTLFSMPEHDWKYHFHLVLGASCMVWLSNSNTHSKVQYDSTPRLSKDIYNKYTGYMQSLLWKKCWTYWGQLHAWVAFLIKIMSLGMDHGKGCKNLYWYLHRSINNVSAYSRGKFVYIIYMEDKACLCVQCESIGSQGIIWYFTHLSNTWNLETCKQLKIFLLAYKERIKEKNEVLSFLLFCCPASMIRAISMFSSLCVFLSTSREFLSVHSVTSLTPVPPAPLPAMAELGNMQPRSKTTSIPYYQESAHCRSQGFNLFVPVSAQD